MASHLQGNVTAVFRNQINAENAYHWLRDHGYDSSELNVLFSDAMQRAHGQFAHCQFIDEAVEIPAKDGSPLTLKNQSSDGAALGGAIGTAVGASLAALAAVGASVAFPGLGVIVVGPVLAALAGGGAGALTGGAIGGLVGLGISETTARAYESALQEGGVVLGVSPHSEEDRGRIKTYFEKIGGESVCCC